MRGSPKRISDFKGGVNLRDASYLLDSGYARDALNVTSNPQGAVVKRNGWSTFANPTYEMTSLFAQEATSTDYMIGHSDNGAAGKIYSITSSGTVADISAGSIDRTAPWEWVTFPIAAGPQGPVYGMNATDTPRQWPGSGNIANWTASSGTLPNGKYIVAWGNRLWVAGMTAYGSVADPASTIVFSDIGDARVWPTANVTALDPNDGDYITGLGVCGPYLLVFKRYKVYAIYDSDTSANRRISTGVGCMSHRTIVETPPPVTEDGSNRQSRSTFFMADDGVYVTDGSTVRPVSDLVKPVIDLIPAAQHTKACAAIYNDRYYLSLPTSGTANDKTLEYDLGTGAWWVHDCKANQYAVWGTSGHRVLYAANTGTTKLSAAFADDVYQDNNSNFTSYWTSAWLTWKTPFVHKRVRQLHMEGLGNVDLYYARNFASATSLYKADVFSYTDGASTFGGDGTYGGDGVFGDVGTSTEGKAYTMGVARAWCFEFRQPSTDPLAEVAWRLDGLTPMLTVRKN